MWVIKARIHKMLVRIANREDADQTALGLHCLSRPFWYVTSIGNFRTSTVSTTDTVMDKALIHYNSINRSPIL